MVTLDFLRLINPIFVHIIFQSYQSETTVRARKIKAFVFMGDLMYILI